MYIYIHTYIYIYIYIYIHTHTYIYCAVDAETGQVSRPGTGTDVAYRPGSNPIPGGVTASVLGEDGVWSPKRWSNEESRREASSPSRHRADAGAQRGSHALTTQGAYGEDASPSRPSTSEGDATWRHQHQEGTSIDILSLEQPEHGQTDASALQRPTQESDGDDDDGSHGSSESGTRDNVPEVHAPDVHPDDVGGGCLADIALGVVLKVLRFVDAFSALGMSELRVLACEGVAMRFLDGEVIVEQGDEGDSMFVVLRGSVCLCPALGIGGKVASQAIQSMHVRMAQIFGTSALVWDDPHTEYMNEKRRANLGNASPRRSVASTHTSADWFSGAISPYRSGGNSSPVRPFQSGLNSPLRSGTFSPGGRSPVWAAGSPRGSFFGDMSVPSVSVTGPTEKRSCIRGYNSREWRATAVGKTVVLELGKEAMSRVFEKHVHVMEDFWREYELRRAACVLQRWYRKIVVQRCACVCVLVCVCVW
jgi:hypothetical protein